MRIEEPKEKSWDHPTEVLTWTPEKIRVPALSTWDRVTKSMTK